MSTLIESNSSTSLKKFQQRLKEKKVLNNNQLKNSCTDFLNSTNLEICVKSLLFEIISYQTSVEKTPSFQIPVENIFQKEEIDFDIIYTDFLTTPDLLLIIQEYLSNIDVIFSSNIVSLQKYFWLVTFPNLFGAFLSSESCIDAKYFIEKLFEFREKEKIKDKGKENYSYPVNISLAVMSFVSHNFLFYDTFYKSFFCELISDMKSNTADFQVQFIALKNALKKAALTFNQYQIEILQLYFKSTFPQISVIQSSKSSFQYQEILDKLIYPVIKIWDFSPYLQGNSTLFKKEEGQTIYQKLEDYLSANPDKITELIQPFVDIILPTNKQLIIQKEDDLVPFSDLNLQKSSKVLTNLDIIIIKDIHNRIKKDESTGMCTNQSFCKDKSKLMFYYQIIESNTQSVFQNNSRNSSFSSGEKYFENQDLNKSVIDEFIENKISERIVAQWLKLKERTKYGSDYDEIIRYQIGMIIQINYNNNDNDYDYEEEEEEEEKEEEEQHNRKLKEAVDNFIQTGIIELEQDIKTRDFIAEKFRNFASTIKTNSNILDEILIPLSTSWILSLKKIETSLEEHVSNSFIETLKDFYSKYTKYEDPKNDITNPSCIDLSTSVGDNSEFDLLNFLLNGETKTSNISDAPTEKKSVERLKNDEYRSGKGSSDNFYSFLLGERKQYDDIEIMETKRSIEFLYKLYIDYVKRGLLLANTVSEPILLMSDDQFKKTYKASLNNLFLLDRKPTNASKKFYIILEQLLPFLSYLLRPLLYDLQENNNTIEVCLVLFENTTSLINRMLDQICTGYNTQQLASYTILRAIKYIKGISTETKSIDKAENDDNKRKEEGNKTDDELNSFCEKKLITFYKFLANQNAYLNYPELQKLSTYFFPESSNKKV